jgi:RHS repeat-associated protein
MDYFNPAAITDAAGDVKERYAFTAFGVRAILNPDFTVRSSSECALEFGFQGQFLDSESGLMNYGYRYYSPQMGRWTCKDSIEEDGGLNLYEFVANDGVNWVDHLGLASFGPGGMGPPQAFDSSDAAGRDALDSAREATKESDNPDKRKWLEKRAGGPPGKYGFEYCGLICKKCIDGQMKYINTGPRTDNSRGTCNPDKAPCPDGWEKSGEYHTHPDGKPPSPDDKTKTRVGDENYVGSGTDGGSDYKYTKTQQPGTGIPQNNVSPFP